MAEPIRLPDNISTRIRELYNNEDTRQRMELLVTNARFLDMRLYLYQHSAEPYDITITPENVRLASYKDIALSIRDNIILLRNVIVPPIGEGITPTVPIQLLDMTQQDTATILEMKERLDSLVEMANSLYIFLGYIAIGAITPERQPDGQIRTLSDMMKPYTKITQHLYKELIVLRNIIQQYPVVQVQYPIIPVGIPLGGKTMKVKKRRKIRKQRKTKRTNYKKFIKHKY